MAVNAQDEQRLALFIDFENIAIGVRDAHYRKFDVNLVLERLLEKGKMLVKKAYADWSRYSDYKRSLPRVGDRADRDAAEVRRRQELAPTSGWSSTRWTCRSRRSTSNCFVVLSGDSDFSPLVSKLKENNKYVIGLGVKNSTSDLLIENCDEFIFYEDLVRVQQRPMPAITGSLTEEGCRTASGCWSTRSWRCSARTRSCSGARWSRRP